MTAAIPGVAEARRGAAAQRASLHLARGLALGLGPREALEEAGTACAQVPARAVDVQLMARLVRGLDAGESLPTVLAAAGVPASFVEAVRAGTAAGELPAAARAWAEMEQRERGRTARLLDAVGLYVPVIAVLYGALAFSAGWRVAWSGAMPALAQGSGWLTVLRSALLGATLWVLVVGVTTALLWRRPGAITAARLPGAARIAGRAFAARLAERLALLLDAGVGLGTALRLAGGARLDRVARRVEDGVALSPALAEVPWLSRWLAPPVRAAEASGDLPGALRGAADELRTDAGAAVERLRGWIIAVGVLTTALLVGAVAVSFYALSAGQSALGGGAP